MLRPPIMVRDLSRSETIWTPADNLGVGYSIDATAAEFAIQEPEKQRSAINVIVPIGGVGSRFAKSGYRFPKPLINIVGRPMLFWLIDHLRVRAGDTILIAISEIIDAEFHLARRCRQEFPDLDIRVIHLKFETRGAAETLFIVSQSLTDLQMERRTVSLDCDTIYFDDILSRIRNLPVGAGATVTFDDAGDPPVFSYVKTDPRNRIVDIKEKIAISTHANTGAYVFPSGFVLRNSAAAFLDHRVDHLALGEYYTSSLILDMIQGGHTFYSVEIPPNAFTCVGTPAQLTSFLTSLQHRPEVVAKRRFCFDLDSTLVTPPTIKGDYSSCLPIPKNIKLVQQLHQAGHHIIVHTARRMKTHKGNVGAVVADVGLITLSTLSKFDIPYDEIFFGKPWAHCYIDDLAVNAMLDTDKEIGWMSGAALPSSPGEGQVKGMLVPRSFNTVQVVDNVVIKSSMSDAILGEIYFFSRIPDDIEDLFPGVLSLDHVIATQSFAITMQRVQGITFSHLLVSRALTRGRFATFLDALNRIHKSSGKCTREVELSPSLQTRLSAFAVTADRKANVYSNYADKVRERYEKYRMIYEDIAEDHQTIADRLLSFLADFESAQKASRSMVIHGDPVFSNIILTPQNKVFMIDMRGRQGDIFTTEGDAAYDLAKVLQSLQGYDFALLADPATAGSAELDQLISPSDRKILAELEAFFWQFVKKHYPDLDKSDVILLTASLLFSLLPLHDPPLRPVFYRMCRAVLQKV